MSKHIVVISTSLRTRSNSERLADEFIKGAKYAGHNVEKITLHQKSLHFCKGCMAYQIKKEGHCIIQDDADLMIAKIAKADVIVFATPIYFYEMSAQMKTLLDRTNPLFPVDYRFHDIYLLASAADDQKAAMDGAIKGLQGWIDCFAKASLKGVVYGIDTDDVDAILAHPETLTEAYQMGLRV